MPPICFAGVSPAATAGAMPPLVVAGARPLTRMSTEGSAKPAMKTKITNASSRFMATPANRMIVRTLRGLALKLRGSSA